MDELLTCEQNERIGEWMSLAMDGLLEDDRQRRLDEHLAICAPCREEWALFQQITDLLSESPMVGPPFGFSVRVERKLAEREGRSQRSFGGVKMLAGWLSLAGVAAATVGAVVLAVLAWRWLGTFPAVQEGSGALSQVASGVGLVGKGASLFLRDFLVRYGMPLLLLAGASLALLGGLWVWLLFRRQGDTRHNGYA